MPTFPYVDQRTFIARDDALGHSFINQMHINIEAIDAVARLEHLNTGSHNALEVPWILGHMADGATPTGYLFDTAFGGATLGRPATGAYTVNAVAGVVSSDLNSNLIYSAMGNVADAAIESKPHTITVEAVSATSFKFRVRELSSALGAGNTWADVNRNIDVGIHAQQQDASATLLASYSLKQRRDFLTQAATDWNSIVSNQGVARKAALLEHTSAGLHSANRIAKGVAWTRWTGAAQVMDVKDGCASISRISQGVVEIIMDGNFSATTTMACFPEPQGSSAGELVITNGRGFATGAGSSAFRFYTYAYAGGNWARADRSFFAAMFGVTA